MNVFAPNMKTALSFSVIALFLFMVTAGGLYATGPDLVQTHQDDQGWKLRVNYQDYFVKGIVWGYTPIGENYSYNLWGHKDSQIMAVLDYECGLMKKAGINTIRSFGIIPPRWVTYIYEKHGIMTIVNHLMGRYGFNVNGAWIPQINYSDPATREALKADILTYGDMDQPGVLLRRIVKNPKIYPVLGILLRSGVRQFIK